MTFWRWFVAGSGGAPGYKRLFNRWLAVHVAVGVGVAYAVTSAVADVANTVFVPLIGVFVGMSFAWGANAHAMLQTDQIRKMTRRQAGGFPEYVFTFQAAILVTLATLAAWGLAGLRVFDLAWPTRAQPLVYGTVENILYSLASLTLRECWHVVVGTQLMLLQWSEIKNAEEDRKKKKRNKTGVRDSIKEDGSRQSGQL